MLNDREESAKSHRQPDLQDAMGSSEDSNANATSLREHSRSGVVQIPNAALQAETISLGTPISSPIAPLGHSMGIYYFMSPAGELRPMKAEALEAGRGVESLFNGISEQAEDWCRAQFPARDDGWSVKDAGKWIIKKCNSKGVFDLATADLRSAGVWRDVQGAAVAHCGNCLVRPDGTVSLLRSDQPGPIMISSSPIPKPNTNPVSPDVFKAILQRLKRSWGWKRNEDAEIWLGWVAAASLGGFPKWRTHLYVHGSRGSGKSTLMDVAVSMLGQFAGDVVNDATEAGLRQSRNNHARPILIDEFEPDDNARNATRQDSMLGLFRRMSGGKGGSTSRGSADHSAVKFRTIGAVYLTSINHIDFQPQDSSRFVVLDLAALPKNDNPEKDMEDLSELKEQSSQLSAMFRGRMLAQSQFWDANFARIVAQAKRLGADTRTADTAASILAGLDLLLFDGQIDDLRLAKHEPLMLVLIGGGSELDQSSEGLNALEFLLSCQLQLDQGLRRTVRELVDSVMFGEVCMGVNDPAACLARYGIYALPAKGQLAVRSGRDSPVAELFSGTKWRTGAHVSALNKIDGVEAPKNAIRVASHQQHRVLLIALGLLRPQDTPDTRTHVS
jgi:hypothetical protein